MSYFTKMMQSMLNKGGVCSFRRLVGVNRNVKNCEECAEKMKEWIKNNV